MTSNPDDPTPAPPARPPRGGVVLALALVWVGVARLPLVLNARAHLDSDLAVDGLALVDAVEGRWRWHYPATPFIGSPAVLLSYIQARAWGPGPMALVSGGVAAYGLVVLATYLLNRRAFGPSAAAWGLVPLAFASTGVVWLSGRVTGGHLLAAAWHAGAFALLWGAMVEGSWQRSAALGLWCGFGLYVDSMVAVTWAGLVVAAIAFGLARRGAGGGPARAVACFLAFALASGVGVAPRWIGSRVDPHDAYVGQFEPILTAEHLARNARILLLDCLPRLVAGHRLPGLQTEPDPASLGGGVAPSSPRAKGVPWLALAASAASIGLFSRSMVAVATKGGVARDPARFAIRLGLLASTLAVVAGFLAYPSISNSDHYRYLVTLLVPWSSGFGLWMARLAGRGRGGAWSAWAVSIGFAALMTVDTARWFEGLGWVDAACRPIRRAFEDPALAWLEGHPSTSMVLGDYWDVYRLSYLTGGRVKAVPFPQYPDRFPENRRDFPGSRDPVVIVRPGPFGPIYREKALAGGGREVESARGLSIVQWPGGLVP